jgi:hypothetical protein
MKGISELFLKVFFQLIYADGPPCQYRNLNSHAFLTNMKSMLIYAPDFGTPVHAMYIPQHRVVQVVVPGALLIYTSHTIETNLRSFDNGHLQECS